MDEQQARQLLGVDTGPVSLPDLREARNNALKAHHPDKVGSDPAAVRRSTYWTAQINVAYELLEPLAEGGKPINPTSADRNGPQRQSFAAAARRAQERVAAQERAAAMAGRRSAVSPVPDTVAKPIDDQQSFGTWRIERTDKSFLPLRSVAILSVGAKTVSLTIGGQTPYSGWASYITVDAMSGRLRILEGSVLVAELVPLDGQDAVEAALKYRSRAQASP